MCGRPGSDLLLQERTFELRVSSEALLNFMF